MMNYILQIVYIVKQADNCLKDQACTLTTAGIQATVECNYTCSCDIKTCDVILLDKTDETETVCEISMSSTIN